MLVVALAAKVPDVTNTGPKAMVLPDGLTILPKIRKVSVPKFWFNKPKFYT